MLLGAAALLVASARRPKTTFQRKLVVAAWALFSIICIAALGLMFLFGGGGREKAMALLLLLTGIAFAVRSAWQAGRKRRHKWDNYFDK
ncbi:hypothetical protein ACFB49_05270 [Sphingomonas sp. DBB INV C78]|uniref:hypothetical protein n=1 Tax=Sphingomonas sp. DBB INV C78 TaxID=3349434 RepID=UPI0036D23A41